MLALLGLLGAIMAILVTWWFFNIHVPEGFSKPNTLRLFMAISKVYSIYFIILDKLGIRSMLQSGRLTTNNMMSRETPSTEGIEMVDTVFDGVPVRVYTPVNEERQGAVPGIVYLKGGGWSMVQCHCHGLMVRMVRALDMVIVSVDYRLAPEFPFPVPFEDCVVTTKYFLNHSRQFGVDPDRVVIWGESAGANLAAAVTLKLRDDRFLPMPKLMILIVPCLQALDFKTPSMLQNDQSTLKRQDVSYAWSLYISGSDKYKHIFLNNQHTSLVFKKILAQNELDHEKLGGEFLYPPYRKQKLTDGDVKVIGELKEVLTNPYLCPLLAEDVRDMPSTYIVTAHHDVVRDDGLHFARKLQDGGIKVELNNIQKGIHILSAFVDIFPEAKELFDGCVKYVKNNLIQETEL